MKTLTKSAAFIALIAIVSGCSKDKVNPASSGLNARATQLNSGPVTVTSISPASGINYTAVTITGSNFDTLKTITVKFNGVTALVNSATSTQIVATVPGSATTGTVTVTTDNGSASAPTAFKVVHMVENGSIDQSANPIITLDFKSGNTYGIQSLAASNFSSNRYAIVKYANGALTTLYKTPDNTHTYTYNFEGLATDSKGNIYTALEQLIQSTVYRGSILKITPAGNVSVLVDSVNSLPLGYVDDLVVDGNDNVYFATGNTTIYKITPAGSTNIFHDYGSAYYQPILAIDKSNNIYVGVGSVDAFNNFLDTKIDRFTPQGAFSKLVGGPYDNATITSLNFDGFNNLIATITCENCSIQQPYLVLINSAGYSAPSLPEPFIPGRFSFDNYGNAYYLTTSAITRYSPQ